MPLERLRCENVGDSFDEYNVATGEKVCQELAAIALKMMGREVVLQKNQKLAGKI